MFNLQNLNETTINQDLFKYSADATMFRAHCRKAASLGIEVTVQHDPQNRVDVITLWEKGEELVSRQFDPMTGGHNACVWLYKQLVAYISWE